MAVMFRNWFVVIPTALVTAVLGFLAFSHVAPQYEAQASVLFLSPNPSPTLRGPPIPTTTSVALSGRRQRHCRT